MRVSIHQPNFLPWLGFFDKINSSDLFVLLDDVQVSKEGFVTRNKIRTPQGWTWLTVPTDSKSGNINEVHAMTTPKWIRNTIQKIDSNYSDKRIKSIDTKHRLIKYLSDPSTSLAEFNIRIIKLLCKSTGITTPIILSSDLNSGGSGSDRILNICEDVGADEYLSGIKGKEYLTLENFAHSGIKVVFQDFHPPTYTQLFPGFESNLSAIDKLLCTGEL